MFNINLTEEHASAEICGCYHGPQEVGRHGWRPDARRT
jgi:hypothetical protein